MSGKLEKAKGMKKSRLGMYVSIATSLFGVVGTVKRGREARREGDTLQLIDVTEQGGLIPGLQYRGSGMGIASQPYYVNNSRNVPILASMSYITGQHAFKTGFTENDARSMARHRFSLPFSSNPSQMASTPRAFMSATTVSKLGNATLTS